MTQRNDKVTATVQVGGMINYTPCSIEVGEVTTLPAGSDATVTNSGNEYEAVFDFGIPQGAKGDTGETGATGKSAYESAVEQGYEGTEEEFATSLTTVDTKAAQAAASATAAAGSATSASNSATSASNSATTATTKASEASASATAAAASATSAGSNATAAQNYVTQASTFASNASNSATNAASYASNAAASATNASAMASAASTSASSASASADTASAVLTDPDFVAVAGAVEDITTVATNISDVNATGQAIEDVSAVADNLTDISLVANDLENIDEVATKVAEWQKPADWVDIRSFAPANSIVLLVGHKADYSKYPSFSMKAEVSNSGTYDVFVDGIKQATTASGTATTLTWQTLALTSGYDVTYPEALRTHIVRITPTLSTNTLTKLEGNYSNQGTLWAHITALNAIRYNQTFKNNAVLDVITSASDEILVNFFEGAFQDCASLKQLPVINCTTTGNYYCTNSFTGSGIKKATIKNAQIAYGVDTFRNCPNLEEIELINSKIQFQDRMFENCPKLKRLPPFWLANHHLFDVKAQAIAGYSAGTSALEDTVVDFSSDTGYLNRIVVNGSWNGARVDGIKGVMVSPNSPLASGTSPQIDVKYTGLDRAALVNLFKSMPYNVGYTVVGSPTITSGVVSNVDGQNYLKINGTYNSGTSPFEVQTDITTASVSNTYSRIFNLPGISLWTQGGVGSLKLDIATTNGTSISFSQGYQPSTRYVIKLVYDGANSYAFYVNNTLVSTQTGQPPNFSSTAWYTYYLAYADAVSGTTISMDLNNTYIKINGIPWFTGKAAMTKTCNVVGCTGTADLTAEDKAIATDKGWALTLS